VNLNIPQLGGSLTNVPSSVTAVILSIRHHLARGLRTYSLSLSRTGSMPPDTSLLLAEAYLKAKRASRYPQPASQLVRGNSGGSVWNPSGVDEEGNPIIPSGGGAQAYCEDEEGVRRPCAEEVVSSPAVYPTLVPDFEFDATNPNPPHYWREGNTVHWGGVFRWAGGGLPGFGWLICSVGEGYRPSLIRFFAIPTTVTFPVGIARVQVTPSGYLAWDNGAAGVADQWMTLDGISYRVD
jgi:hypothetical protein